MTRRLGPRVRNCGVAWPLGSSGSGSCQLGCGRAGAPRAYFPARGHFPYCMGGGGSYVALHAATHVPLALCGYATTSSVLAIALWSLVRSTVSSTPPVALFRRAFSRGRPGAMTPKIARFLAEQQPATPCLVLDVDRVEDNFRALQRALPLARIYYAVKANPAPQILERLVRPVAAASMPPASRKLLACLDAGARPEAISFGNTIKKASAIRDAFQRGVYAVRLRFGRGTGEAGEARARGAGVLPHPGGERRRRLAAVAQVRHHGRERARR